MSRHSDNGGRSTRQWMLWAFKLHGCSDCGIRYPDIPLAELHCDHRDPSSKADFATQRSLLTLSNGNGRKGLLGIQRNEHLLEELLKCDVVCVTCHQRRTKERGRQLVEQQETLFRGTGEAWTI